MATWAKGTYGPWSPDREPGDGEDMQPGPGQPGQRRPGKGKGQGEPGDGQGEPGDGSSGSGEPDIDSIYKDLENKFKGRGDSTGKEEAPERGPSTGQGGSDYSNTQNQNRERIDKPVTPAFTWKELMSQFVMSQKRPESTYAKVSKRSITGVTTAVATGAGVVKPGERSEEEAFKLLFVFDSSGSMYNAVQVALVEAQNLINQNFDNVDAAVGVTFFAGSPEYYAANLSDKNYWPVASFNDLDKSSKLKRPIKELFSMRISGATNFSTALANQLGVLAGKGYNIILFTDSDILDGNNWKVFLNFYKNHKRNFFLILDSRHSFNAVCKQLGSVPNTFGSLDL